MKGEELLCFVWEHRLFPGNGLCTTSGQPLEVILPGVRNMHAGPDFTDARIRIGSVLWAGNVEVHQRSTLWKLHGHHRDPVYNSVILHVVLQYEEEIINAAGQQVLTCELRIPDPIKERLNHLLSLSGWPGCEPYLKRMQRPFPYGWIRQLGSQRIDMQSRPAARILSDRALSREEALYRCIARGFGLPVNMLPFERLAAGIPYALLCDNRHSLPDLEAILFGQAGFLSTGKAQGPYAGSLLKRYHHFDRFFPSGSNAPHLWKYMRLRPNAFPTVRIAQFASLLHHRIPLMSSILEAGSLPELEQQFRVKASPYWDNHYLFQKTSPPAPKFLGTQAFQILTINALVPYLLALGQAERRKEYFRRAKGLLMDVEAESNHIIKKWTTFGIRPANALESQGLLQLQRVFCLQKRCLDCRLGISILEDLLNEKS